MSRRLRRSRIDLHSFDHADSHDWNDRPPRDRCCIYTYTIRKLQHFIVKNSRHRKYQKPVHVHLDRLLLEHQFILDDFSYVIGVCGYVVVIDQGTVYPLQGGFLSNSQLHDISNVGESDLRIRRGRDSTSRNARPSKIRTTVIGFDLSSKNRVAVSETV